MMKYNYIKEVVKGTDNDTILNTRTTLPRKPAL